MPARLGRSIAIRRLAPGDVLLTQAPRPAEVLADRYAQGALCFAAIRDDRLAGFLWLCRDRYSEDDVRCTFLLPENGVAWWDFDVWISPDQRNGVLFAKLWNAATEFLRDAGAQWTCSRITRQNVASIDAHRRLGATFIGHAVFIQGRRWQLSLARKPRIHLSRAVDQAPVIPVIPPRMVAHRTERLPRTSR
jgi:GNAT superfamily N-acetyltransferase